MGGENVCPRFQPGTGEIAVDTAHACFTDLGNLFEEAGSDASRGIVGVDENGQANGVCRMHDAWSGTRMDKSEDAATWRENLASE